MPLGLGSLALGRTGIVRHHQALFVEDPPASVSAPTTAVGEEDAANVAARVVADAPNGSHASVDPKAWSPADVRAWLMGTPCRPWAGVRLGMRPRV